MKKITTIIMLSAIFGIVACKGNPNTTAGDSTGTGSAGARIPGNVNPDTTKHDSTNTFPKKAIYRDSANTKSDTAKK